MGIRAGDIRQFTWYGREFDIAPDTDVTIMFPGLGAESTPNGNGTPHIKGTRKLGGFDGLAISVEPTRQDAEFLVAKQTAGVAGPCTLTLVSGVTTYAGSLLPEGDLQVSTGNGSMTLAGRGQKWAQV